MRESGEGEEDEKFGVRKSGFEKSGGDDGGERAENKGKRYRMCESAMREQTAALDSERKSDDIGIGNHRAGSG